MTKTEPNGKYHNDPDNWLQIPEFGVRPVDVNFEGFAIPVIGPANRDLEFAESVRHSVRAVRTQAQRRFGTLAAIQDLYNAALHAVAANDDGEAVLLRPWTLDEMFAYRFGMFMWHVERALFYDSEGLEELPLRHTSAAMQFAVSLQSDTPPDARTVLLLRSEMGKQAVAAKLRNDSRQLDKLEVKECWNRWQSEPSRYADATAFARDMQDKYTSLKSLPVITRWCREWRAERAE